MFFKNYYAINKIRIKWIYPSFYQKFEAGIPLSHSCYIFVTSSPTKHYDFIIHHWLLPHKSKSPQLFYSSLRLWLFNNGVNAQGPVSKIIIQAYAFCSAECISVQSHSSSAFITMNDGHVVSPHCCTTQMTESHSRRFPVMFATKPLSSG